MAIVTRRYKFVGPSDLDLSQFVGSGAVQNASVASGSVLDIDIDDSVTDVITALDEYMTDRGFVFDATIVGTSLVIEDEGIFVDRTEVLDFVGAGVGAVKVGDKVVATIPGAVTDGAVVQRDLYVAATATTSSGSFVDAMGGLSIPVPIDGDYDAVFEAEGMNQSASGVLEVGISVDSLVAAEADSERSTQGPASDLRTVATSIKLSALTTGQLVRVLFRRLSGGGAVELDRRRLKITKVQ